MFGFLRRLFAWSRDAALPHAASPPVPLPLAAPCEAIELVEEEPPPPPPPQPDNIIAADTRVGGPITTCNSLLIAGVVSGDVICGGDLELEQGGEVRGNVLAEENVTIRGYLRGDLEVRGRLMIASTGRVRGSVRAGALVVEEGGELNGPVATGASAKREVTSEHEAVLDRVLDHDDFRSLPVTAVPA